MFQPLVFLDSCGVIVWSLLRSCGFGSSNIALNSSRCLFFSLCFVKFRRYIGLGLLFDSLLRSHFFLFWSLFFLIDFHQLYTVYLENELN